MSAHERLICPALTYLSILESSVVHEGAKDPTNRSSVVSYGKVELQEEHVGRLGLSISAIAISLSRKPGSQKRPFSRLTAFIDGDPFMVGNSSSVASVVST